MADIGEPSSSITDSSEDTNDNALRLRPKRKIKEKNTKYSNKQYSMSDTTNTPIKHTKYKTKHKLTPSNTYDYDDETDDETSSNTKKLRSNRQSNVKNKRCNSLNTASKRSINDRNRKSRQEMHGFRKKPVKKHRYDNHNVINTSRYGKNGKNTKISKGSSKSKTNKDVNNEDNINESTSSTSFCVRCRPYCCCCVYISVCIFLPIFALYRGIEWIQIGNDYQVNSTQEICTISAMYSNDCTYSCGCIKWEGCKCDDAQESYNYDECFPCSDNDDDCYFNCHAKYYKYDVIAHDKCDDQILYQLENYYGCEGSVYLEIGSEHVCWVEECSDGEFIFEYHRNLNERNMKNGIILVVIFGLILALNLCFIIWYIHILIQKEE